MFCLGEPPAIATVISRLSAMRALLSSDAVTSSVPCLHGLVLAPQPAASMMTAQDQKRTRLNLR